jgi:hypothetical protein
MRDCSITVEENPSVEDFAVLSTGLTEFNFAKSGVQGRLLAVYLRNAGNGILGGAYGWTFANYLYVDTV